MKRAVAAMGWFVFLVLMGLTPLFGQGDRALVRVEPLPLEKRGSGSGGLFIGVNEFLEGSSLRLRFAVDDAIAQAHVFVEELGLLEPRKTVLLLSGEPTMPANREKLQRLTERGVVVGQALRGPILAHLRRTVQGVDGNGLLVISVATHGFERDGVIYVLPNDGFRDMLTDTAVNLNTVQAQMNQSRAGKKLLLVDACRENVEARGGGGFTPAFQRAFQAARGHAVLLSTGAGQLSYERPELGHGVFTYHLLQGLRGGAPADGDGILRLGALSDYVARSVREWWMGEHPGADPSGAQQPWFSGEIAAKDIPLAQSRSTRNEQLMAILGRARQADRTLITGGIEDGVYQALQTWPEQRRSELISQLELLETNHPVLRRNFVLWWNQHLGTVIVPPPQPRPSPSPPPQREDSNRPNPGRPWTVDLGGGTELELLWIAPGEFTMGSPNHEGGRLAEREGLQTQVRLTKGFWLGKYEVTVAQWRQFADSSGYLTEAERDGGLFFWRDYDWAKQPGTSWKNTFAEREENPVVGISWNDALVFAQWLTDRERNAGRLPKGYIYSLPSEAQWEFAARAGTQTRFYTGDSVLDLARAGWLSGNSRNSTQRVGLKEPNAWGLFDMHGNVWEWTRSKFASYPGGRVVDYEGPSSGASVVYRGGSWNHSVQECRSAHRGASSPSHRNRYLGFRLALAPSP